MSQIIELLLAIVLKILEMVSKRKKSQDDSTPMYHNQNTDIVIRTAHSLIEARRGMEQATEQQITMMRNRIHELEDTVVSLTIKQDHSCDDYSGMKRELCKSCEKRNTRNRTCYAARPRNTRHAVQQYIMIGTNLKTRVRRKIRKL